MVVASEWPNRPSYAYRDAAATSLVVSHPRAVPLVVDRKHFFLLRNISSDIDASGFAEICPAFKSVTAVSAVIHLLGNMEF